MIEQIAIAATGVTAIWLTQSKSEKARRFACLFGLAGQPFWFASAIAAEQWGIVVLCCFYTVAWARGVWNNWLSPKRKGADGLTRGQRALKEAHGTPEAFASAVWRAVGEISVDEAQTAINKYQAEWEAA
ncbi:MULTISPECIES: hypothetical protein [unclassified Stenotrophomonas maltophilia group]|uniref:hypothetical protein n=1 Tax=unclassified Stenotrophomonas maltophilia group TaxID=2961925 RepID=UPI003BF8DD95